MNSSMNRSNFPLFLLALLFIPLVGCIGPARVDPIMEIDTAETAFVVPLEGATGEQAKFDSVELFEQAKVAAKRITIPQRERKTGRMPGDYEWIPTVRVIKVRRAPITVKWAGASKDHICVESKDSIGFCVGIDLTAEIKEEDASTFLYNYGEKDLGTAINKNVRSVLVGVLSREFGNRDLVECKSDKGAISALAYQEVGEHFEEKGITISNLGLTDGLTFENPEIQKAINATFMAEQAKLTAVQDKEKAKAEAEVRVAEAKGEAQAAAEFQKAQTARTALVRLEIERMQAEAALEMAKRWDGKLPSQILPSDSPLLMSLSAK